MIARRPTKAAHLISTCLVLVAVVTATSPVEAGVTTMLEATEPAEQVHSTIDEILERPAYTGIGQSPLSRLLRENPLSRWLLDVWERFLDWLRSLGGGRDPAVPTTQQDPDRSSAGLLVALFAVLLVATVAFRLARTRDERAHRVHATQSESEMSISELEQRADEAERRGAFDEAIRLRFQAGLRRLDEVGVVDLDAATPTGQVRAAIALHEFDAVANRFELAAYSEHPMSETDANEAARGWRDVFRVVDPSSGDDREES